MTVGDGNDVPGGSAVFESTIWGGTQDSTHGGWTDIYEQFRRGLGGLMSSSGGGWMGIYGRGGGMGVVRRHLC